MKRNIREIQRALSIATLSVITIAAGATCQGASSVAKPTPQLSKLPRLALERKNFRKGSEVVFSPNGRTLAVAGENLIQLWDTRKWVLKGTIQVPKLQGALAFRPDSRTLLVCTEDRRVQQWDVSTRRLVRTLPGLRTDVAFSPSGALMAGLLVTSSETPKTIGIWDTRTSRRIQSIRIEDDTPYVQSYFSTGGKLLAIAYDANNGMKHGVEIWNVQTGKRVSSTQGTEDVEAPVVFSPNGKTFATPGTDPDWQPYEDPEHGPTATDGGTWTDFVTKLWDVRTGKLLRVFKGWSGMGSGYDLIEFTLDGKKILCRADAEDKFALGIFDMTTGNKLGTIETSGKIALSPDGKTFVDAGETLRVWKVG